MAKSGNKDLTVGNPTKVIWDFSLPLFLSMLFQQLYNLADTFVAGKFINDNALGSVSVSYEITLIIIAICTGLSIGISVIAADFFGAKKYDDLICSIHTTFITSTIISVLLLLLGLIFARPLLVLINTPENLLDDSIVYLRIYMYGVPTLILYNIASGIFTALGDSKTTFYFLAASSTANIFMDIAFVKYFKMGVDGLAWATFICQSIACVLSLIVVLKKGFEIKKQYNVKNAKVFSWPILSELSKVSIPSILQQSFVSVGNIAVQSVINSFGTVVVNGYGASIKVHNTIMNGLKTFSTSLTSYAAQNLGAQKYSRIRKGFKASLLLTLYFAIPVSIIVCLFPRQILGLFLERGDAMEEGRRFILIVAPFYALISVKWTADGVLRGTKHMAYFMVCTFLDLILRVALTFILSKTHFGSTGIWLSWPLGWIIGSLLSFYLAHTVMKDLEKKELLQKEKQEINNV